MKKWLFLDNVFENVTSSSFRLALRISVYHASALLTRIANPVILALYNAYLVIHDDFVDKYGKWTAQKAQQLSDTQALYALLHQLGNEKVNAWDAAIAVVYPKGSVRFKALFPHGHRPFQHGTQEDRIDAVNALLMIIGSDAALATVKAAIQLFYTSLTGAVTTQKGSISLTQTLSDELELARIAMCTEQYGDLGGLMQLYKTTKDQIGNFFDLRIIRSHLQVTFTGSVKLLSVKKVLKRTFDATTELTLVNDGVTVLRFYKSATANGVIGETFTEVASGTETTLLASAVGSIDLPFLLVFNPDEINTGEYTVEVV